MTEAAEAGNTTAQTQLSQMYLDGLNGIPQDKKRARYWSNQAQSSNSDQ